MPFFRGALRGLSLSCMPQNSCKFSYETSVYVVSLFLRLQRKGRLEK